MEFKKAIIIRKVERKEEKHDLEWYTLSNKTET